MVYELIRLAGDGEREIDTLECPNDTAAELLAWQLSDGRPMELRQAGRLVKRLDPLKAGVAA